MNEESSLPLEGSRVSHHPCCDTKRKDRGGDINLKQGRRSKGRAAADPQELHLQAEKMKRD